MVLQFKVFITETVLHFYKTNRTLQTKMTSHHNQEIQQQKKYFIDNKTIRNAQHLLSQLKRCNESKLSQCIVLFTHFSARWQSEDSQFVYN